MIAAWVVSRFSDSAVSNTRRKLLGMVRDEGALADARFAWRGEVTDEELVTLTQSYGGMSELGDGGDYAFLIDTKVRPDHQRRGIGTELLRISAGCAKEAGVRVVGGCGR